MLRIANIWRIYLLICWYLLLVLAYAKAGIFICAVADLQFVLSWYLTVLYLAIAVIVIYLFAIWIFEICRRFELQISRILRIWYCWAGWYLLRAIVVVWTSIQLHHPTIHPSSIRLVWRAAVPAPDAVCRAVFCWRRMLYFAADRRRRIAEFILLWRIADLFILA